MTASPGAADPIVAAVAADLDEWTGRLTLPEIREFARQAVEAHRRAVLDRRDDGERLAEIHSAHLEHGHWDRAFADLFAALADETVARRQAEAERDDQVERATEAHVLADQMRRERDAAWAYQNQRADKGWQSYHEMRAERDALLAERDATAGNPERHAANGGTA